MTFRISLARPAAFSLSQLLACLTLSGCEALVKSFDGPGTVVDGNWWTLQAGLERTGSLPGPNPSFPLVLQWQRDVSIDASPEVVTPPVLGAGLVVFGTNGIGQRRIQALSLADGAPLWTFEPGGFSGFHGAPAIASGIVYAASIVDGVYALHAQTGLLKWNAELGTGSTDAVTVAHDCVYVRTQDARLFAFEQQTGALVWSSPAVAAGPGPQDCAPAVGFGRIYASFGDGIYAFDAHTGVRAWKYPLTGLPTFASLILQTSVALQEPARLLVATQTGEVHAIHAGTGASLWVTAGLPSTSLACTLLVSGRRVLCRHGSNLRWLDTGSGAVLATRTLAGDSFAWPPGAVVGNTVYFGDTTTLRALDFDSLALRWHTDELGPPASIHAGLAAAPEPLVVIHAGTVRAFAHR
jgi:outer membrane protein assembly factor BamB